MRNSDQKKYIETLLRYEKKFTQDELKDFKMFAKRNKDDEDLDNISFQKLKNLYTKYYVNREKIDINEFFKKK
ncbi:MAG: hypothetical protein IPM32_01430 [Ignavibacteriae bacterium]|nr:hypothetical protein [Ignavibacteriota bacterium]MBK8943907.1 hypothetical protein [Ignavibacteriota bacterium]